MKILISIQIGIDVWCITSIIMHTLAINDNKLALQKLLDVTKIFEERFENLKRYLNDR